MEIKDLRQRAKEAGIKSWHNKKPEKIVAELEALNVMPIIETSKLKVSVSEADVRFFKSIGFKEDWLLGLANQYGFTEFQYMAKFKAFRCYIEERNMDWIDVNDLSLLNGGRKLTEIGLPHQQLPADRQVIKLPWRSGVELKINDPSMR